ncbi:MAG: 50S ribosomal protein L37ae [archaeon]
MAGREIAKSVRRFGARYGRRTRLMFGQIEQEQRSLHKCPYCSDIKAKRISVGIWECKKCNVKFTGKAYKL